jgi:hypothetical protein
MVGLTMSLYAEGLWPVLDEAVGGVGRGDGAMLLALADQYAGLVDFATYFAVSCLDLAWPADPDEHLAAGAAAAEQAPRFGEALVNDYLRCALWPTPPDPLGPITAAGAPPILLVSTTGDPATPHASALAVAARMPSAVLLTREGEGHTVVFRGDPCVDGAVVPYLVSLEVPDGEPRC